MRHRFAVIKRDKMEVAVYGWISDFFAYFQKAVAILTDLVKQRVSATVDAFEARAATVFANTKVMWDYFTNGKGVTANIKTLWLNTRCDICQGTVLHLYQKGCAYIKQGICSIVTTVACGGFKGLCQQVICPLMNKYWLDGECANIVNSLNSALKVSSAAPSPIDNFATLSVCRRIGLCNTADQPFDGSLFQAIVEQAKRLNVNAKATSVVAAAKTAIAASSPVKIPAERFTQPGTYSLPGLGCVVHVWINIQVASPKYGKPYYILDSFQPGSAAKAAGVGSLWWLYSVDGKHIDTLGPQGVLTALSGMPGSRSTLIFEDSGFFGVTKRQVVVTYAAWPVNLVQYTRTAEDK
jgi:hypothetical protein